jgi:hypothetical protein
MILIVVTRCPVFQQSIYADISLRRVLVAAHPLELSLAIAIFTFPEISPQANSAVTKSTTYSATKEPNNAPNQYQNLDDSAMVGQLDLGRRARRSTSQPQHFARSRPWLVSSRSYDSRLSSRGMHLRSLRPVAGLQVLLRRSESLRATLVQNRWRREILSPAHGESIRHADFARVISSMQANKVRINMTGLTRHRSSSYPVVSNGL